MHTDDNMYMNGAHLAILFQVAEQFMDDKQQQGSSASDKPTSRQHANFSTHTSPSHLKAHQKHQKRRV
jgi:hypothetical protein